MRLANGSWLKILKEMKANGGAEINAIWRKLSIFENIWLGGYQRHHRRRLASESWHQWRMA